MPFKQIEKELFDLKCINGAMYFGCVEKPCSGRETGECCHNEQTWEEAEIELKSFLKQSFIKYLKDEVERLEKKIEDLKEYPMWNDFVRGQNEELEDQITHLQAQVKELES